MRSTRVSCAELESMGLYVPFFSDRGPSKITLILGSSDFMFEKLPLLGKVFMLCDNTALGIELSKVLEDTNSLVKSPYPKGDLVYAMPLRIKASKKVSQPTLDSLCSLSYTQQGPITLKTIFPCESTYLLTSKSTGTDIIDIECTSLLQTCPSFMSYLVGDCFLGCSACHIRTSMNEDYLQGLCDVSL